ncbi:MAG TPA: hypothetical protein VHI50_10040 [Micromonosporaceae bacterium]|nr:hypothetical protein [Micromonosporaceae bacterium]
MRLRGVLVVTGLGLLALAGCGGVSAGADPSEDGPATSGCSRQAAPPEPIVTAGATMYPTSPELDAALGRIQEAAPREHADTYAGLEVVPERGHAIVYRVPPADDFDAFVEDVSGGQCIYIRDAEHTNAELTALQERITNDATYWGGLGVRINAVGARHDGSAVEVGTEDVARAEAELPRRYGADAPIVVVEQGPIQPL